MYTYNECSNDDTYNIQIIYSLLHSPASFFTNNQSEKIQFFIVTIQFLINKMNL